MDALRAWWNVGVRKASGEACVKGRAMNCDSCVGSAVNRSGIVAVWLVDILEVGLLVGRTEIFDEAEKRRAGWTLHIVLRRQQALKFVHGPRFQNF